MTLNERLALNFEAQAQIMGKDPTWLLNDVIEDYLIHKGLSRLRYLHPIPMDLEHRDGVFSIKDAS